MRKLRLREGKSLTRGSTVSQLRMVGWEARSFPDTLLIPTPQLEVKERKRHPSIREAGTSLGKRIVGTLCCFLGGGGEWFRMGILIVIWKD